jgi:hypothetical protein
VGWRDINRDNSRLGFIDWALTVYLRTPLPMHPLIWGEKLHLKWKNFC